MDDPVALRNQQFKVPMVGAVFALNHRRASGHAFNQLLPITADIHFNGNGAAPLPIIGAEEVSGEEVLAVQHAPEVNHRFEVSVALTWTSHEVALEEVHGNRFGFYRS